MLQTSYTCKRIERCAISVLVPDIRAVVLLPPLERLGVWL